MFVESNIIYSNGQLLSLVNTDTLLPQGIVGHGNVILLSKCWGQKPSTHIMKSTFEKLSALFGGCEGDEHIGILDSALLDISLFHIPSRGNVNAGNGDRRRIQGGDH